MSNFQNFEEIARQLMACAPTEKAAQFADRLINKIRAKGEAWIDAHAAELRITFVPGPEMFPVSDNRLYYIAQWQVAVA